MRPLIKATSGESRSSLATMIHPFLAALIGGGQPGTALQHGLFDGSETRYVRRTPQSLLVIVTTF
jgi:hypothetical protein